MKRITLTDETRTATLVEARSSRAFTITEDEADAGRRNDPDALPPMSDAEIDAAKGKAVRHVREATGLSQAAFAQRFHIPIGTLRDWEGGRRSPDAAALAYLRVIERRPEMVAEVLAG